MMTTYTYTNIPTTTYTSVEQTKNPFPKQINTTSCDISCTYIANDTVCVWGVCTHIVYNSPESYNECQFCSVKTSFCFDGSCYRTGRVGDICRGNSQCQSLSCGQVNNTSYNICLNVDTPPTTVIPQVLYSIIGITLLLLCACMVRRHTQKPPPRQVYISRRRSERRQRDEESAYAFETENADTLPPYEAAPPKYEAGTIMRHSSEQEDGGLGEHDIAANSVIADATNSNTYNNLNGWQI